MIEFKSILSSEEWEEKTKDWPIKYYSTYEERMELLQGHHTSKTPYRIKCKDPQKFIDDMYIKESENG